MCCAVSSRLLSATRGTSTRRSTGCWPFGPSSILAETTAPEPAPVSACGLSTGAVRVPRRCNPGLATPFPSHPTRHRNGLAGAPKPAAPAPRPGPCTRTRTGRSSRSGRPDPTPPLGRGQGRCASLRVRQRRPLTSAQAAWAGIHAAPGGAGRAGPPRAPAQAARSTSTRTSHNCAPAVARRSSGQPSRPSLTLSWRAPGQPAAAARRNSATTPQVPGPAGSARSPRGCQRSERHPPAAARFPLRIAVSAAVDARC
jgi:hypothetical protein